LNLNIKKAKKACLLLRAERIGITLYFWGVALLTLFFLFHFFFLFVLGGVFIGAYAGWKIYRGEYEEGPIIRHLDLEERYRIFSMCDTLRFPYPWVYVVIGDCSNVFVSVEKGKPTIYLGEKILRLFSDEELMPVIAHELSHVKNHDHFFSLFLVLGASLGRISLSILFLLVFFVSFFVGLPFGILFLLLASVLVFWITSAKLLDYWNFIGQEKLADAGAVLSVGAMDGIISGLERILKEENMTEEGKSILFERISFLKELGEESE